MWPNMVKCSAGGGRGKLSGCAFVRGSSRLPRGFWRADRESQARTARPRQSEEPRLPNKTSLRRRSGVTRLPRQKEASQRLGILKEIKERIAMLLWIIILVLLFAGGGGYY